jgi:hypothetical protein
MSVALLQNMPDKHRRGQPLESRIHAVSAVRLLCGEAGIDSPTNDAAPDNDIESSSLPLLAHVYGEGPLLLSDIPQSCRSNSNGVVLGIDEAGRGTWRCWRSRPSGIVAAKVTRVISCALLVKGAWWAP